MFLVVNMRIDLITSTTPFWKISLTINILVMFYCIYQLKVKSTLNVHVGEREEMEMLCVQVDEQQLQHEKL